MLHCRIHGREFEHGEGCPECREAEACAENDREELLETLERVREEAEAARTESDYKQANPGDYECPECRYDTLRRMASRCPKCHARVAASYWTQLLEREQQEAEERERQKARAAEEWARGEPERQRRARAEAEARAAEAARLVRETSRNKRLRMILTLIAVSVLGVLGAKWFAPRTDTAIANRLGPSACTDIRATHRVIRSVSDTFVGTVYSNEGGASAEQLSFGGWGDHYYDYFRFELPKEASLKRPSRSVFCLYATDVPPNDAQLEIAAVGGAWDPGSLTIGSRPVHRTIGSFGRVVRGWNAVDVSSIVNDWVSGQSRNYGITLIPRANNQTNGHFAASEFKDENRRPRVILVY